MTWLRHAPRHVHQTAFNYLEAQLAALKWTVEDETPFGTTPVRLISARPFVGNKIDDNVITDGTVAFTLGSEMIPVEQELGGPLTEQDYPFFVDVFMSDETHALSLASDIKDIFLGRFPDCVRALQVIDQVTGNPAPGWMMEFEEIERVAPEHSFALSWQSVHVTARTSFNEVIW